MLYILHEYSINLLYRPLWDQEYDAQNDELEAALKTLEGAIHKIDKETRSLFKDTFDKLNASLQDLFPKVFGGGTAYTF